MFPPLSHLFHTLKHGTICQCLILFHWLNRCTNCPTSAAIYKTPRAQGATTNKATLEMQMLRANGITRCLNARDLPPTLGFFSFFFSFFPRSPLSPFPPALRFFPDSFQLICARFYLFSGYFFHFFFFYGISIELGPFFHYALRFFFMGYVSQLLTTKGS